VHEDIFGYTRGYSVTAMLFERRLPSFDTLLSNSQFKLYGQNVKCSNGTIAQLQHSQAEF